MQKSVLSDISCVFTSRCIEQGFLLGSSCNLTQIDYCCQLPASRAGKYFYKPDSISADQIIQNWGENGICFCGLIHSHIVNKQELSENDIKFAKQLFAVYNLPVLWFGIGVVNDSAVNLHFYSVTEDNMETVIFPVEIAITE